MTCDPDRHADPTPKEIRLGELVDRFEDLRAGDATIGIGSLQTEAGELFPELAELAECLDLLEISCGEESRTIPESFGPYRIDGILGSGVSGTVYRATRRDDDPPVALKIIRETLALDREARKRFLREVVAAARVEHPHIVPIVDHGEVKGRPYIATELVEGISLDDLLDRIARNRSQGPVESWLRILDEAGVPCLDGTARSPGESYARRMAALFAPAARALRTAAEAGLIHRDLKPGNLFVARDGRLRILDFGLAKILGEEITSTVAVLGTPGFMCPEQASGRSRDVDERSDVYGLGASLYRALTLKYPVDGDSFSEVLAAIQSSVPDPVHAFSREYPRSLSRVVGRCLAKDPRDRHPSAGELADDLERVAAGRHPSHAAIPLRRRAVRFGKRFGPPFAAALVLVLLGVLWFTRPGELDLRVLPGGRITVDGEFVRDDRWNDRIPRGDHRVVVTRVRFLPWTQELSIGAGESHHFEVHLRPENAFDPETTALLAEAYGLAAAPDDPLERARGLEKKSVPEPDETVIAEALSRWPMDERSRPEIRLLAARGLLAQDRNAEAFALALAVADEHRDESAPLRLALVALARMEMTQSEVYAELWKRWGPFDED